MDLTYHEPEKSVYRILASIFMLLCSIIFFWGALLSLDSFAFLITYSLPGILCIVTAITLLVKCDYRSKAKLIMTSKIVTYFIYFGLLIYGFIDIESDYAPAAIFGLLYAFPSLSCLKSSPIFDYNNHIVFSVNKNYSHKKLLGKSDIKKTEYYKDRIQTRLFLVIFINFLYLILMITLSLLLLDEEVDMGGIIGSSFWLTQCIIFSFLLKAHIKLITDENYINRFQHKTWKLSHTLSTIIALILVFLFLWIPLGTNILTVDIALFEKTFSMKGFDIIEALKTTMNTISESENKDFLVIEDYYYFFIDAIEEIQGIDLDEILDTFQLSKELARSINLIKLTFFSGIASIILALVWFFRSLRSPSTTQTSSTVFTIISIIVLIVFSAALVKLANTWNDYTHGLFGIKVSTEVLPSTVIASILCIIYAVVNNSKVQTYFSSLCAIRNVEKHATISESEIINLLQEYKKLVDDGVISEEDYILKKTELLNQNSK